MRGLWLGAVALAAIALAGPAYAQSSPPYVPGLWDGFYVGLNAGGDWATDRVKMFPTPPIAPLTTGAAGLINGDDVVGGGQIGFNHEFPGLIAPVVGGFAGVEADFDYTGLSGTRTATFTPPASKIYEKFDSDWLATARLRLGATFWQQFLLYATGGLAVADTKYTDAFAVFINPYSATAGGSKSNTQLGWTLGGGGEWSFYPGWSLKIEYLHVDLGTTSFTAMSPILGVSVLNRNHLTENIARVGINYKFWSM
jgi:outer membrane immunogenic protein